ncbi:MAG: TonB-dependent receptor [Alistipes sp.]|jgi:outer membrane receptor protein involved in Fe transport|nr:TonB-dependent receptor [Alistipes sp.]
MKKIQRFLVLFAALAIAMPAMAQSALTGRIVAGDTGNGLAGAVITNTRTGDVAVSSNDGTFRIRGGAGAETLTVSYLGYHELELTTEAGRSTLGDLKMESDAISVADIVVTAGIVVSDRLTPVAVSNVTREQIDMRLSNKELPELFKSTPSVYATKSGPQGGAGGGYGDARINIRGFDNNNVGVLINGVPVNDMENGRVYWANWGGLSDVTSFMQVQRGLGASKLGISSVGGTINIVTKSTDAEKGGSFYYGVGNDGLQKLSFSVSSGLSENGWAFTIAGGRQSADNNYKKGTDYEAWNYFANLSKVIGDGSHRLSLTGFGAPQWHNQSYDRYTIADYATHPDGRKMSRNYGYMNGKVKSTNYNFYHKPQISLVHTWNIDDKSMLSTSVYASIARGGGRSVPNNSQSQLWLYAESSGPKVGKPRSEEMRTSDGLINWDAIYTANKNSTDGSAMAILANSNNSHDWYGVLSTYTNQLTEDIKLTAGFDGRYYKGYHQQEISDLLGAQYAIENSLSYRPKDAQAHVGDLIYDEIGWVSRAGLFAQGEYVKENFSAFLSASISRQFLRFANYGQKPAPGYGVESKWTGFMPWSVKAGASYTLGQNHSLFANAGYFTIAPAMSNAFPSYGTAPNKNATMEKVTTAEAGYTFTNNVFNVTFNGYYTLWLDMAQRPITEQTPEGMISYNVPGVSARHMGLELEATYRPTTRLTLKAMGSVGDWIWRDDVSYTAYNEQQVQVGAPFTAYIGGTHVSDAAQITAAGSVTWSPFEGLRVGADYNWYGKNFARFIPSDRAHISNKGIEAWRMPDYGVIDAQLSYTFDISEKISATFFGNVNNVLDTWYISDATDNRAGNGHDAASAVVWYGYGRTWTAGVKFNF